MFLTIMEDPDCQIGFAEFISRKVTICYHTQSRDERLVTEDTRNSSVTVSDPDNNQFFRGDYYLKDSFYQSHTKQILFS